MKTTKLKEPSMQVDAKQRYLMITEAAYFLAEKRGFTPGHEHDDWLTAERQVDEMLSALQQSPALEQRIEAGEKLKRGRKTAAAKSPAEPARRTRKTAAAGAAPAETAAKPTRATRARKPASEEKPAGARTRSRAKGSVTS